ncbi:uncharacterized protein SCHCODRAFT_01171994 [Schizophyllum commune H4-8]|nr:uncharacterized protein SCHCODRAFT_01171994 [Schizophyllum commune H4-8]KAI5890922.1 hypothetical protein SCHCODRAFT_01171994 [Schizophyllum commune H4-8]
MDNAGNCDTTAEELANWLPHFRGKKWRLRCLLHILNLIAKVILAFFYKPPKKKKPVAGLASATTPVEDHDEDEEDADGVDSADNTVLAQDTEAQAVEEAAQLPAGQIAHDEAAAKTLKGRAISEMRARGVSFTDNEAKECIAIMTKVAGLARRVNDAPSTLGEAFWAILKTATVPDNRTSLSRRVATRWNSDFNCLDDHLVLQPVVETLTNRSDLKLQAYRLTSRQWDLAEELKDLLHIFVPLTKEFSKKETPLVTEVLDGLEDVKAHLTLIRDSETNAKGLPASPVVRVAAHAGLLMTTKYFSLTADECEAYKIAIVMSPDKKLAWFRKHQWGEDEVQKVRDKIVHRWTKSYAPKSPVPSPAPQRLPKFSTTLIITSTLPSFRRLSSISGEGS